MFGRKAVLLRDLETSQVDPVSVLEDFQSAGELQGSTTLEKLTEARSLIIQSAKANVEAAQEKQKKHYDRKHATPGVYKIGAKGSCKELHSKEEEWQDEVPLEGSIHYTP